MNTPALEAFLARVYVDANVRARFLADPYAEATRAGLTEQQCQALARIDRPGLEMAAHSFAKKRDLKHAASRPGSRWHRVWRLFSRIASRRPSHRTTESSGHPNKS